MIVFPISQIESLRAQVEKACPDPGDGPDGWSKSKIDPMRLLSVFTSLRMKSGFVLRAYQFRSGGNGNGLVLAMPLDAPFPKPSDCPNVEGQPQPPLASVDSLNFVEGDRTPLSYLSASLFAREADEFGAMWHGCNWSTHAVLGTDPWYRDSIAKDRRKRQSLASGKADDWEWHQPRPEKWEPTFEQTGEVISIRFYTFSGLGREAIYRWTDRFKAGSYKFETTEDVVAEGSGGFVF